MFKVDNKDTNLGRYSGGMGVQRLHRSYVNKGYLMSAQNSKTPIPWNSVEKLQTYSQKHRQRYMSTMSGDCLSD